ncbi:hypothetical protein PAXRUDRAFT_834066 [Paxillus rubicundulus Ve08.2h10]|uniref:Uncharacterized protein n=1 Tax=Paxillus rubicundulus Ve08.2h10 TaxID=930991 RepID=A0A0D0DEW8_9AGAM|nr:hypothetical protein PAXRUDRAFT_834066 [Paxillus rubicundulus Ve08.2h10]
MTDLSSDFYSTAYPTGIPCHSSLKIYSSLLPDVVPHLLTCEHTAPRLSMQWNISLEKRIPLLHVAPTTCLLKNTDTDIPEHRRASPVFTGADVPRTMR